MRTISAGQERALARAPAHARVTIKDAGGTWRDWTNLPHLGDCVLGLTVTETLDSIGRMAQVTLQYRRAFDNASPQVSGSRLTGYLALYHEVKVELGYGATRALTEWVEVFHGVITNMGTGRDVVELECLDLLTERCMAWHEADVRRGASGLGDPMEDTMRDILDDYARPPVPSLYTPTSPGATLGPYAQAPMTCLDALRNLAVTIGWDVRSIWDNATSQWRLTLYEPERSSPTVVRTFAEWVSRSNPSYSLDNVRNAVRINYVSGTGDAGARAIASVEAIDAASIALYGRRYCEISEGATSRIDTSGAASALAAAVLADLATPEWAFDVEVELFPWVQLQDFYAFAADNEPAWSTAQQGAVVGFVHQFNAGAARTTLSVAGKPRLGRDSWLYRETGPGQAEPHNDLVPEAPAVSILPGLLGNDVILTTMPSRGPWDQVAIHRGDAPGFTPSDATIVATTRARQWHDATAIPGETYYYRVFLLDRWGNEGVVTAEVPTTTQKLLSEYIEDEARQGLRAVRTATQAETPDGDWVPVIWTSVAHGEDLLDETSGEVSVGRRVYQVNLRVESTGDGSAATWRARIRHTDNGGTPTLTTLWTSPSVDYPNAITFNGTILPPAAGGEVYVEVTCAPSSGTIEIDAASHFEVWPTLYE